MNSGCQLGNFDFSFSTQFWSRKLHTLPKKNKWSNLALRMSVSILERFWTSKFWKRNLKHELAPCSYIYLGLHLSCSLVSYLSVFHLSFYFLSHVLLELSISKFWKQNQKNELRLSIAKFRFLVLSSILEQRSSYSFQIKNNDYIKLSECKSRF